MTATSWTFSWGAVASSQESKISKPLTPGEFVPATDVIDYPDMIEGVPITWIEKYANLATFYAQVTKIDRGLWYATIPQLPGVGSDGKSEKEALDGLHDVIMGWVAVKLRVGAEVPVIEGLDLNFRVE